MAKFCARSLETKGQWAQGSKEHRWREERKRRQKPEDGDMTEQHREEEEIQVGTGGGEERERGGRIKERKRGKVKGGYEKKAEW